MFTKWREAVPAGLAAFTPGGVEGIAVHYTGSAKSLGSTCSEATTVRRVCEEAAFHVGKRGWSDIAYNFLVDQEGRVLEGRGLKYRSAANGGADVNRRFVAVTVLIGVGDTPTAAAVAAVRRVRGLMLAEYPKAVKVVCHSDLYGTECPGAPLRALVRNGSFMNKVEAAEVTKDDAAMIAAEVWNRFTVTGKDGKPVSLKQALEILLSR